MRKTKKETMDPIEEEFSTTIESITLDDSQIQTAEEAKESNTNKNLKDIRTAGL